MSLRATRVNETHMIVAGSNSELDDLDDFFSFFAPGYRFQPRFRAGYWDGKIRLFSRTNRLLYVGLLDYLREFADDKGGLEVLNMHPHGGAQVTTEEAGVWLRGLRPVNARDGVEITPDDEQIDAVRLALNRERLTILSPTASGKSLIIYGAARWLLERRLASRILIIVHRMQLVDQMADDFNAYSRNNGWPAHTRLHRIFAGQEKLNIPFGVDVVITTWQSVYKMEENWFKQFDAIFPDEAHTCKAKSLVRILEACTNARYRVGTTGTLDGSHVNQLIITGLIGEPVRITTTRAMIAKGRAARMIVVMLHLDYPPEDRREVYDLGFVTVNTKKERDKAAYQKEYTWVMSDPRRLKIICDLVEAQEGRNTAVFFMRKDYGKELRKGLRKRLGASGRAVHYVDGSVERRERRETVRALEAARGDVWLASLGTSSTGISVNNLHVGVLASPFKAEVMHLQTLGRLLRLDDDDVGAVVYDVVDDLRHKKKSNFCLQHAAARMAHYVKEGHKVQMVTLKVLAK